MLPAGGSCLLGALNLSAFVKNPFTKDAYFAINDFAEAVIDSVYALNEVLDEGLELHPLEEQRKSVQDWRQIGLGMMGLADCLIKLGIVYGSNEANDLCNWIAKTMFEISVKASEARSYDHGNYPMFNKNAVNSSPMLDAIDYLVDGLNNSQLLTIAPTGSISTMLGISGGIEPIFANSYTRKTQSLHGEDVVYKVYTPIVKEYMNIHNITDESQLPKEFVISADISPKDRINCQAAWQKWIDASISSTINLPNEATVEDVENIYMYAWESGLKGVTVYRAGCAREGILVTDETKENIDNTPDNTYKSINDLPRGYIVDTSDDLIGYKRKLSTGCGSVHMEVYFDETSGDPQETFINIGSGGGCERNYQFISRLISLALRAGVPIEDIIDQANSIRPCTAYVNRTKSKRDTSPGTSCPSAIGKALQDLCTKMQDKCFDCDEECNISAEKEQNIKLDKKALCPECGTKLQQEGGCNICKNCGWTKCD